MKQKQRKYDFSSNEYTEKMRVKPDKHQWFKENYRKFGKKSAAELLDFAAEEFIKPNLFKQSKKK